MERESTPELEDSRDTQSEMKDSKTGLKENATRASLSSAAAATPSDSAANPKTKRTSMDAGLAVDDGAAIASASENGDRTEADVLDDPVSGDQDSGEHERTTEASETEAEEFMRRLEAFFHSRDMELKVPKFYGEEVDLHKLWNVVISFGGYEKVTSGKLWRVVGDNFEPPKSCTTLSWTFRGFYEKTLLDYEKHSGVTSGRSPPASGTVGGPPSAKRQRKQLETSETSPSETLRLGAAEESHKGRASGDPEKGREHTENGRRQPEEAAAVIMDEGLPADWVRVNVRRSADCFEVYALVPGLVREEVRVQCEGGGKLIIAGEPEQPENPWGVTAFRKVIMLPGGINAHQTTAMVTLHGQLYVKAPFAPSSINTEGEPEAGTTLENNVSKV